MRQVGLEKYRITKLFKDDNWEYNFTSSLVLQHQFENVYSSSDN